MTARIALALLVVIPAAMAYPWHTPTQRWVLGVAVTVVLLTFAWWGGMFLTTRIGRWLAVWRRCARGSRRRVHCKIAAPKARGRLPASL